MQIKPQQIVHFPRCLAFEWELALFEGHSQFDVPVVGLPGQGDNGTGGILEPQPDDPEYQALDVEFEKLSERIRATVCAYLDRKESWAMDVDVFDIVEEDGALYGYCQVSVGKARVVHQRGQAWRAVRIVHEESETAMLNLARQTRAYVDRTGAVRLTH